MVMSSGEKQLPEIPELKCNNPIQLESEIWQDHPEQLHFGYELLALSFLRASKPSFLEFGLG